METILKQYSVSLSFDKGVIFFTYVFLFLSTIYITFSVNSSSVFSYCYFLLFWTTFIVAFDSQEVSDFILTFVFNAFFTAIFIAIQSYIYPNSYGLTSELTVSYTDDSYFFSLIADEVPNDLVTRYDYQAYNAFFSDLIRFFTPFGVKHPLDVVYFQSGVAAIVSTYTKQYAYQISKDKRLAKIVYFLCIFSPFLLMHGGALLIRDTLVAGLFMLSLCCINRKRWLIVVVAIGLQFLIRSGTGFILILIYPLFYFSAIKNYIKGFSTDKIIFSLSLIVIVSFGLYRYFSEDIFLLLLDKGVGLTGREVFDALTEAENTNRILLFIQSQILLVKSILSAIYIYLYPFLTFAGTFNNQGLDIRILLVSIVYPIYSVWLNAWTFSVFFHKIKEIKNINTLKIAFFFLCIFIGLFSLQTRHKTIITPLFYILAGTGYCYSKKTYKYIGFIVSIFWLLCQIFIIISK